MYSPYVLLLHDSGHVSPATGHFGRFDRFIDPRTAIGPFRLMIRGSDQCDQATSMVFPSLTFSTPPLVICAGTAF
jgi:hypothetical protein